MTECPLCNGHFDPVFDQPTDQMGFDKFYVDPILEYDKTCTIRYLGPDDYKRGLEVGEILVLVDDDGVPFAHARIVGVIRMTAEAIVESEFSGHSNYHSVEHLAMSLRSFYPDVYIGPGTELWVFFFDVLEHTREE